MKPRLLVPVLSLAAVCWFLCAPRASVAPASAAPAGVHPRLPDVGAKRMPANASTPEVRDLDRRIKALRDDLHGQIDPLQAQIKALRDKFEPQIKELEDQRRTLIEQGKPTSIQQLDVDEQHELADLAEREKAEIEQVRSRYSDERHAIQQKFERRREEARAAK